jgi:succinoglycan biosynthesis transport protein ExoP
MNGLNEGFRILRVRVADQVGMPTIVVVTSALSNDGATYVACGLARACAEFEHRTLLVDAHGNEAGAIDFLNGTETPLLSVRGLFRESASDNVDAALRKLRDEFDIIVVDAPPVPNSSLALSLARAADGVIFAVRLGRKQTPADEEMVRVLAGRQILGVVPNRASRPVRQLRGTLPLREAGGFEGLVSRRRPAGKASQ